MPPGVYELRLGAAASAAGPRLDVLDAAGNPLGSEALLGSVIVRAPAEPLGDSTLPYEDSRHVTLGDGLRLAGFSASQGPLTPGNDLAINLFWRAVAEPASDLFAFTQLLDSAGQVAAAWEGPPLAWHPTSAWQPNQWLRSQHVLRLPATLADGDYRLITGLFDPVTGRRLPVRREPGIFGASRDHVALRRYQVVNRAHDRTPPNPQVVQEAKLSSLGRLVGYDLPVTAVAPGEELVLTLYWQATETGSQRLQVFVHLLDEAGQIIGQSDQEPGDGSYPTSGWLPGEYLVDGHAFTVRPTAASGSARLVVGLYDPDSGQRIEWLDEQGQPTDQPLELSAPLTVSAP
jgi:hypothetical protein